MYTEFNADFDEKKNLKNFHFFGYFAHSEVLSVFHRFLENFTSFKYQNFVILGQFLTLENMVEKFFQNSNFSDFLGIKSEINQYIPGDFTNTRTRLFGLLAQTSPRSRFSVTDFRLRFSVRSGQPFG